jgi:hypothetical protein
MPPVLMRELAEPLRLDGEREIYFLGVYLIHPNELAWKLAGRLDDLLDAFGEHAVTEEFDLSRPSVRPSN